jgi:hypothetical protein
VLTSEGKGVRRFVGEVVGPLWSPVLVHLWGFVSTVLGGDVSLVLFCFPACFCVYLRVRVVEGFCPLWAGRVLVALTAVTGLR